MKYPRLSEAIQLHRVNFPAFSGILWRLSDHTISNLSWRIDCQCEQESEIQKWLEWGGGCCKCLKKTSFYIKHVTIV